MNIIAYTNENNVYNNCMLTMIAHILYLLAGYILGGEFLIIWSIPYLIVSSVIYSLINTTTPSFALGIILAGLTPFISMFLLMGGCLISSI